MWTWSTVPLRSSGDNSSYGGTDAALFASGATTILTVTNSSIAHTSGDGIVLSGAPTVSVNGSQLTDNLGYALRGQFGVLTSITGTTFTGNGHGNRISMPGGTLTTSVGLQIQTNPGFGGVEFLTSLTVSSGITLTLSPGMTVMFDNLAELKVLGHLEAVGTATQPITFTSLQDSGPYQWRGLAFDGSLGIGGTANLVYATVRYGGQPNSVFGYGRSTNIALRNVQAGAVHLDHTQVLSSSNDPSHSGAGIYAESSQLDLISSTIRNNVGGTIDAALVIDGASRLTMANSAILDNIGPGMIIIGPSQASIIQTRILSNTVDGIRVTGTNPRVTVIASSLVGNGGKGVNNTTTTEVDARWTWWGDPSGPQHATNPTGTGSAVTDYVRFEPWLTAVAQPNLAIPRSPFDHTTLTYDPTTNTHTRRYLDGTTVHFNADGTHDETRGPTGNRTRYRYNPDGSTAAVEMLLVGETTPRWVWTYSYTGGKLTAITDPAGRTTTITQDALGHLRQVTFPDGTTRRFFYTATGLMTQQQDQNGNTNTYTYDAHGRIASETFPPHPVVDPATGTTTVQTEVHTFQGSDTAYPLLNTSVLGTAAAPAPPVPTSAQLEERITDSTGTTRGHTDALGSWVDRTDPLNRTTQFGRDSGDNLTRVARPDGSCQEATYSAFGQPLQSTSLPPAQCALPPAQRDPAQLQTERWTYEPQFGHVKTATDPLGRTTTFQYDYEAGLGTAGMLVQITLPAVANETGTVVTPTLRYTYTPWGALDTMTDARGVITQYRYTHGTAAEAAGGATPRFAPGVTPVPGLLTAVVQDVGGLNRTSTADQFDAAGNAGRTRDANGTDPHTFQYDPWNRVVATTDAFGVQATLAYDGKGNAVAHLLDAAATNPAARNILTTWTYDAADALIATQTVGDGRVVAETRGYDAAHRLAAVTDGLGARTSYHYDGASQLTAITDAAGYTTTYSYTLTGLPAMTTDADGYQTTYAYDGLQRLVTSTVDPGGLALTTSYQYDLANNLLRATQPDGVQICTSYDAWNRPITTTDDCGAGGLGLVTTTRYDVGNLPVQQVDWRGTRTEQQYDRLGRLTAVHADAAGLNRHTSYAYDAAGNLATMIDPYGTATAYTYDLRNRPTQVCADPTGLNRCTTSSYDRLDQVATVLDGNGILTQYDTNAWGQLERVIEDVGGRSATTSYAYDAALNLTAVTDANGHTTTSTYTARHQLAGEIGADSTTAAYSYDGRGNVVQERLQDGQSLSATYDGAGRQTAIAYSTGGGATYGYDPVGRLRTATETANGHTTALTWHYNAVNDVTSTTQRLDAGPQWTTAYQYDYAAGRLTMTYPSGQQRVQEQDAVGRLTAVRAGSGPAIHTYAYNDPGHFWTETAGNGVQTRFDHDALGAVTRIQSAQADYRYGYDGAGRRTFQQRAHQPTQPADVYQYNPLNQLTTVWEDADATTPAAITGAAHTGQYALDDVGNRLETARDGATTIYGPQNGTQLTNPMNRYEVVGGATLTYDARGNQLTTGSAVHHTYDLRNRRIGYSGPGTTAEYLFDALGRRVATVVNGVRTELVYDTAGQVIEERAAGGGLLATYTYGATIDQPLTMERGGQTYTYQRDALGSVTEVTNSAGALVERYTYDVYGAPRIFDGTGAARTTSAIGNHLLFTGRPYDPESATYDYRARQYDPAIGRFLQPDSFPGFLTEPQSLHDFAYVQNSPATATDPSGHSPKKAPAPAPAPTPPTPAPSPSPAGPKFAACQNSVLEMATCGAGAFVTGVAGGAAGIHIKHIYDIKTADHTHTLNEQSATAAHDRANPRLHTHTESKTTIDPATGETTTTTTTTVTNMDTGVVTSKQTTVDSKPPSPAPSPSAPPSPSPAPSPAAPPSPSPSPSSSPSSSPSPAPSPSPSPSPAPQNNPFHWPSIPPIWQWPIPIPSWNPFGGPAMAAAPPHTTPLCLN